MPNSLVASSGSGWGWTSFTPTWTNLTVGNGTNTGRFTQIGKFVIGWVSFTLNTTSSVGSGAFFNLPVTPSTAYGSSQLYILGGGVLRAGGTTYLGFLAINQSLTTSAAQALYVTGSPLAYNGISSSTPGTWSNSPGTSDYMTLYFSYQVS